MHTPAWEGDVPAGVPPDAAAAPDAACDAVAEAPGAAYDAVDDAEGLAGVLASGGEARRQGPSSCGARSGRGRLDHRRILDKCVLSHTARDFIRVDFLGNKTRFV